VTRFEIAGWLLLASFALFVPVAALPSRVWTGTLEEQLALIAQRRRAWQGVNLSIAGSAMLLVFGVVALAEPLQQAGGGVLVPLSLGTLLLGAALWLANLAFRVTTMAVSDPEPPPGFAAVAAWAGGLFLGWTVLANVAVLGIGVAIVHSGYPATWSGWAAIVLSALMLAQLLATGDAIPGLYHVAPALIGIALLLD
jgi:hypothetical protein